MRNPTTFPAIYPNRSIRRAVKQGRMSRLPEAWRAFLGMNPDFLQRIRIFG